jgi:Arc/MetJ-type ribon-helix-helix transcriptional regulator
MSKPSVRTTVSLPVSLLAATDALVRAGRVRSRSDLVARAVEHELQKLEREAVDAQFALMAEDEEFQAEALRISSEFSGSDWEALREDEAGR